MIKIPPAALERGTEVVHAWRRAGVKSENIARAAFLAMLEAWPGMAAYSAGTNGPYPYIILPLPQEASDE